MDTTIFIGGFLLSFLCVFGLIGNLISVVVLLHKEMRSSTSCLLIGLAFSDSVFLAVELNQIGIPLVKGIDPAPYFSTAIIDAYVRMYSYFVLNVAQSTSILLTIAITIERYIAVIHPFSAYRFCTVRKALLAQGIVVSLAIAGSFPDLYAYTLGKQGSDENVEYYHRPTAYYDSDTYEIFMLTVRPIYQYLVPFVVIAVLNTRIYLEIRRAQARREEMTQSHTEQVQIAVMLLILVLVFGICTLPKITCYMLYLIYDWYVPHSYAMGEVIQFLGKAGELLIVVNYSMNFLIYTTKGAKFRAVLRKVICCRYKRCGGCGRREERRTRPTYIATKSGSNSNTRTYVTSL